MKKNQIIKDHLAHIQSEKFLISKGKSAKNLVKLLDDLQLHQALIAGDYKVQTLLLHIDSYILTSDYVGLRLLLQRKSRLIKESTELLKRLNEICDSASNEDLGKLMQLGFAYIKQNKHIILQSQLKNSLFRFCFSTINKYFVNINLKDAEKLLKISQEQIIQYAKLQGHSIYNQFLVFGPTSDQLNSQQIEQQMKAKLKQIALVSVVIAKYE